MCIVLDIRLNGFNSGHGGRIEILHKGIWGTLGSFDNTFGYREARVACRQLGYHDAFRPLNLREVPYVSRGIIWSSNIKCNGTESRLPDCKLTQDKERVTHVYDVGVICKMSEFSVLASFIYTFLFVELMFTLVGLKTKRFYSGTPPYDHLVNTTICYFPEQHIIKVFFLSKDAVNTTTSLIRPEHFCRTVVVY